MSENITIRPATAADAPSMAILVDIAAHGLAAYFWSAAVRRGEAYSVLEIGRQRAMRDEGSFSWRNASIAEIDDQIAAMLIGYRQPDEPEDVDLDELDPVIRPLMELEPLSAGTWYVNVLASFAEFRGRGAGSALMGKAEEIARSTDARGLSLIVENTNEAASRLYQRLGFREIARKPFHPFPGSTPIESWVLMERLF
ncbi:MAG: GNAT family N-acetyltransferase [Rhizobiales bacterium]|nr:GNAT family N-acetyltransferase [Hyphomicrobiales bacterium]